MAKPSEEPSALRASYRSLRELAQDEIKRGILSTRFPPGRKIDRGPAGPALRCATIVARDLNPGRPHGPEPC